MPETKLNAGRGNDIRAGYVNMDQFALPSVDVVHDLSQHPLPFADATFAEIVCQDVLEQMDYPPVLGEFNRILRGGGSCVFACRTSRVATTSSILRMSGSSAF